MKVVLRGVGRASGPMAILLAGALAGLLVGLASSAEARDVVGRAELRPSHRFPTVKGTATVADRRPFMEIGLHATGLPTHNPDAVFMLWIARASGSKHLAGGLVAFRSPGEIDGSRPLEGGRKLARRNVYRARRIIVTVVSGREVNAIEDRALALARHTKTLKGRRVASGRLVAQ